MRCGSHSRHFLRTRYGAATDNRSATDGRLVRTVSLMRGVRASAWAIGERRSQRIVGRRGAAGGRPAASCESVHAAHHLVGFLIQEWNCTFAGPSVWCCGMMLSVAVPLRRRPVRDWCQGTSAFPDVGSSKPLSTPRGPRAAATRPHRARRCAASRDSARRPGGGIAITPSVEPSSSRVSAVQCANLRENCRACARAALPRNGMPRRSSEVDERGERPVNAVGCARPLAASTGKATTPRAPTSTTSTGRWRCHGFLPNAVLRPCRGRCRPADRTAVRTHGGPGVLSSGRQCGARPGSPPGGHTVSIALRRRSHRQWHSRARRR